MQFARRSANSLEALHLKGLTIMERDAAGSMKDREAVKFVSGEVTPPLQDILWDGAGLAFPRLRVLELSENRYCDSYLETLLENSPLLETLLLSDCTSSFHWLENAFTREFRCCHTIRTLALPKPHTYFADSALHKLRTWTQLEDLTVTWCRYKLFAD